ncbi:MAG: sensor domain-containing diguanylate cyclase [Burkholderiales bacterium PBB1]|nr:MAG: sensor domain-containing diguanylate cyclase [Burkholderiales bacterium PBB1]
MDTTVEEDYEALIQFLYLAPIGLMQTRIDGEILMVNPLCAQLLMPLARDGELNNLYNALESVAPDLRTAVQRFESSHGMICEGWQLRVAADPVRKLGRSILSLTLLKLDEGRLMAVLGDVTQSVQRERELRQSQAWINTIVTGLTDYGLMTLDDQGRVRDWNSSVERVTAHQSATCVGKSYSIFYPPDSLESMDAIDRLHEADRSGWSLDEGWRQRADGSRFWGSCLIAPLHAPDEALDEERAYSLVIRDVSDRREATEALRRSVACDHLTGLANRRALFEACELELQRWRRTPRPLSLVLIDADHFKRINDEHGHAAGDAVLRHLAAGLSATFRAMDIVARLGGEEFVVLLPGCTEDAAATVAQRLCHSVSEQAVNVNSASLHYTVSIGVATMDASVDSVEAFIERADLAMYRAKASGRNRVERWHPGLRPAAVAALT